MTTHSTVLAQETTGKVTAKELLHLVRSAKDSLYLRAEATPNRPSYSDAFTFTAKATHKHQGRAVVTLLDVPGYVHGGYTSKTEMRVSTLVGPEAHYCEAYRPMEGGWFLGCGSAALVDVLECLPGDAEVSFEVYLDGGTNLYMQSCGLHGDFLYLNARVLSRGKAKERKFLIDSCTGRHNTARFGSPMG